jgi:putative ABC transport system ATP-binding protein
MIKTKGLTREFQSGDKKIIAVNNIDIHIPEKQFVSITGKSGSGKSTLLYQLGLLDFPSSGVIHLDGKDTRELDRTEKTNMRLIDLGYVFQDYAILPSLSASENVMIPLLMRGYSKKLATEKAKEALVKVGLGHREDNLPSQLSGGEQQRVAIARAIGHDPKIIFADEPTANLDTETSKVVLDTFKKINAEGQTIVMVTHEEEYAKLTDRIIKLSDGKVIDDYMVSDRKEITV